MKIGIIGLGVIGSACKYGFEKLGHSVKVHDTKLDSKIIDIIDVSEYAGGCESFIIEYDGITDLNIIIQRNVKRNDVIHG